ncbi:TIGR03087 family PEP-CTERM/XrtA system glycosyltransferase [Pseudoduganella sp. FT25W]|uniref:TIGR03087 family PEP-CTERM/XrtA system glycosyltransferase n=1 Tax=Duganella alba TaxID=2666081 RepID=A0A6L5QA31_9BURK|nr:TIGR03087 family PEP-CTERM/XrtA system glycosyltransferase [Duganella alba]MRX06450.1 TIGR03087 family PEP-CTERM/XrtA system glycosyltransferase [Duganella alba]MRX14844.1 TIGR03087 family PEP-CTERM/XrtA system glycosyltransferase [Duganella alba]
MRDLLFLCHRLPYPPNKGEKIRSYHALQYLRQHFRIHLGTFLDSDDDDAYAQHLAGLCASSCFVRMPPHWARLSGLSALLRDEALSLPYFRHAVLQRWVDKTLEERHISTCLAYSGPMAQYLPCGTSHGPLWRVLDLVDVDSEKWHSYADNKPWPLSGLYRREGRLLLEFERKAAAEFDRVLLVSPAEAELFKRRAPESADKVDYYCNGVDSGYFSPQQLHPSPFGAARAIVFTGAMDYEPNIDAVSWFAERVMPTLLSQHKDLEFHIVGSRPATQVRDLLRLPGIQVSGTVPDVRPYLQHAALVVAPLRVARGVQNKVLEAMAMQKIVIASPQALEGISVTPATEVICADGGAEFISAACRQLHAPDTRMGAAARQRILADYRWEHNLQRLGRMLGVETHLLDTLAEMERAP